jgi:RimJ/RimL family protein N-acetyltransferase
MTTNNTASEKQPADPSSDIILTLPNNITVRRYRYNDIAAISKHANNKNIWDRIRNRMPHPYLEEHAKIWIDTTNATENKRPSGPWTPETGAQGPLIPTNYAIVVNDEACGSIGLDFGDMSEIYFRCAEIGYWLGEEHWGKGVMSAVVPAFVDWGWRTFGILIRMNGEVYAGNAGSQKCLEKAGFVIEGRKKWAGVKNGVLGDEVLLGMLRPGAVHEGEGRS